MNQLQLVLIMKKVQNREIFYVVFNMWQNFAFIDVST
jgi:hypothetical protein